MIFSFTQIITWLTAYKYFFLFPVAVVEGPIVTIIAGLLSSLGHLNIFIAYIVIVVADIVGDCIYYASGYYGGLRFIERWGRFLGITTEHVKKLETHFSKHSGKTLIIGKLTHAIGGVVLVTAGVAKVPFRRFVWYNFISTLPKSLILLLIGFYFGKAYQQINVYFNHSTWVVLGVFVLTGAIYLVVKKFRK